MNAFTSYTQGLPSSILGAEPFPTTAFTLLSRAGAVAVTAAGVHGVLAYEVDATAATSGVVYLTGSFLRDSIIAANAGATVDSAFEDALRAKGIYLERSIGT